MMRVVNECKQVRDSERCNLLELMDVGILKTPIIATLLLCLFIRHQLLVAGSY